MRLIYYIEPTWNEMKFAQQASVWNSTYQSQCITLCTERTNRQVDTITTWCWHSHL